MIKEKAKNALNNILIFIKGDTFKCILTTTSIIIACIAVLWGYIMTVLTNDLTNVVIEKDKENQQLQTEVEYYSMEATRYKMLSEEYYELFYDCQSHNYYTGEAEGDSE